MEYFEETWIGSDGPDWRIPGKFSYKMWSFYDQVVDGIPITTNAIEGWHNGFNFLLQNLSNLLNAFILDQTINDDKMDKQATGVVDKNPQKKTSFTERIATIITSLDRSQPLEDYITAISSLMLKTKSK